MNCKLKSFLVFLLFCAVAYLAVKYVPPEWGGYGALVIMAILGIVGLLGWIISVIRHVRNPYEGAGRLRSQARKIAAHDGIPVSTAAAQIYEAAQAQGQTYPKRELDTLPRPVMADRAHMDHIRHNEPMARPGYDVPAQKPALPAPLTWDELAKSWMDEAAEKPLITRR